jgi:hypothetical protein
LLDEQYICGRWSATRWWLSVVHGETCLFASRILGRLDEWFICGGPGAA